MIGGSYIVVNHQLDYDLLNNINDYPGDKQIRGTYMGSMASEGASLELSAEKSDL